MEYVVILLVPALFVGVRLAMSWGRMREQLDFERPGRDMAKRGRRLDASPIADVPEACVVRVVGEVKRLDRWVVAPISKRACAHWQVKVSVLEYSPAERRTYWRPILQQSEGLSFVLASGTDECLIDPSLATVHVKQGHLDESKRGRSLPASYVEYLESAGVSVDGLGRPQIRFEESIVAFGTKVAVIGAGRVVPRSQDAGAETDYRAPQPSWLCLSGTDDELLISDDRNLLAPRGTGGGIKTEAPRGHATASEPSQTEAWSAMDVDEFEGRLAARRVVWRIGVVAAGVLAVGAIVFAVIPKHENKPEAAAVEDPCDLPALQRDYKANGAWAIRNKLEYFDTHCTSSVDYRRLHFAVKRSQGDVKAAFADAEQLLEHDPTNAEVWFALAADEFSSLATLRKAVALATSDEHRREAREIFARLDQYDRRGCDYEMARYELDDSGRLPSECHDVAKGRGTLALAPAVISATIGGAPARVIVDPRVGTTALSPELAERAGLPINEEPRSAVIALDGKLVRGEPVVLTTIAIGGTSTKELPVLVVAAADMPSNVDGVIGLDYLWRFSRTVTKDGLSLSPRTSEGGADDW